MSIWNDAGSLLIAIALFINSIGIIISEPRTLEDSFQGYSGVLPPVELWGFQGRWSNFESFGDRHMLPYRWLDFFKRDHIVFGWSWRGSPIKNLCRLFPDLKNVYIVFDTNDDKWVTLSEDLSRKLGAGSDYLFLVARDEVAATHKLISNNPVYREAHLRACREANDQADIVEQEQLDLLEEGRINYENGTRAIKESYNEAYNRAFTLYLYQH